MGEPAIRPDVIAALKATAGLTVTEMADGSIEVASNTQPIRRFPLGPTVSRGMLTQLTRWYGVTLAAFYPPTSTKPQTNAAGE